MVIGVDDLLPVPQRVEETGGILDVEGRYWRVSADCAADPALRCKLGEELAVSYGRSLFLPDHTAVAGEPPVRDAGPPAREQAYLLRIGPDGLWLRGHDVEGLYWGLVTLEHLLGDGPELPCAEITDWPAFPLRGHHDDISRKQVSRLADFLRIIRRLSRYKVNLYTPYMEDMLYLKSHPDIGEGRGRLTPDEVAAIHREAVRHKVLVMPTYSLIGHQENLLSNPDYAHLGREVFQPMSSLDTAKPEVREFLEEVIRDVCELFPGPYFHAGFDETQGIDAEEFLRHANWCARQLKECGKMMPMWVDMIYNHFGYEMLDELEDNIIAVNWAYGCTEEVPHHSELAAHGRPLWGLAGYNNGCAFVPDFQHARSNIDCWRRAGLETGTTALMASQWGDNGYENHRDMCWNLFAYLGEAAWSGERARREDFERRFQLSFYGTELPGLTGIIEELPGELSLEPGEFWRHFRRNAFAMRRWAEDNPDAGQRLREDERLLSEAMETLAEARDRAIEREDHLEHFRVALLRSLSVVHRMQFALRQRDGLEAEELQRGVMEVCAELEKVREAYEADWLRTNKRPNIEVSLAVYDEVLESYTALLEAVRGEEGPRDGHYVLDLSEHYNRNFLPVAGLPIGEWTVNDVPFLFADEENTHAGFTASDGPVELQFPAQKVADLHLIVSAHKGEDEPQPALAVELLRDDEVVFAEELLSIRQLCDWWAPLGEHIWAGGGMDHVDPERVRYALKPGHMYGLTETWNFDIPEGLEADALRIRALREEEIRLFAVTLEIEEEQE